MSLVGDTSLTGGQDSRSERSGAKRRRLSPLPGQLAASSSSDIEDGSVPLAESDSGHRSPAVQSLTGRGAENGIIESITCTNFMCHSYLHVELGPLINFVVGSNGSGKSAVLTALTICLGGKASSTNRGSTLKAFIKEGQDFSTISVKIKNRDGYNYDLYGDSIIVERTFNRTGASSFKIKTRNGRLTSSTKATLDEILDYYALQLNNPICVLSQDMARQFLHNSNAADKYRFFIKGVQLEQMNQDYDLLSDNIENIEHSFERKEIRLAELEQADRRASERLAMLNRQDQTTQLFQTLSAQMAWAQVQEQEQILKETEDLVADATESLQTSTDSIQPVSEAFERTHEALGNCQQQELALKAELQSVSEDLTRMRSLQDDADKELQDHRAEQRKIHESIQRARAAEKDCLAAIKDEEARLVAASGDGGAMRHKRHQECKAMVDEAQEQLSSAKKAITSLAQREEDAKKLWHESQHSMRNKVEELDKAQQRLREISETGFRQDYPHNMNRLLNAVQRAPGFSQRPIGPIGNHIFLLKPLWAAVLEKTFGAVLNTFIVSSNVDRERLNKLMKETGCFCPISIQSVSSRFNVTANEPDSCFTTISNVLRIDNDMVFNYLVINQRIEQVILIENEQEAITLMSDHKIHNAKACYSRDQRDPNVGHSLTWGVSGGVSNLYVELRNAPSRIKLDTNDQLNVQKAIVEHLESEVRELEGHGFRLRSDFEALSKEKQKQLRKVTEARAKVEETADALTIAAEDIDRGTTEEGRLAALQDGLEAARKEIEDSEHAFQICLKSKDEAKAASKACESERKSVSIRVQSAEDRLRKHARQIERLTKNRLEALQKKNRAYESQESDQRNLAQRQEDQTAQAAIVADYDRQANEVHPRCEVPEGETTSSLDAKLSKLGTEIERFHRELGGDRARLSQQYFEAHAKYTNFKNDWEAERDLLSLLKRTLSERQERWRLFRKHIAVRAKTKFMYLLTERAYRGRLLVDHSRRLMDLRVQPDETKNQSTARQTKTLSGGEKSFSTICLLLALWEAIGAPIRCLDEFDVFMDNANRDISMKLLVNAARGAHDRQFIFITPQAISSIQGSHDVKIIKLRDPERGQTTL